MIPNPRRIAHDRQEAERRFSITGCDIGLGGGADQPGSRRELFVDRFLIDTLTNATLQLHRPTYAGIVLRRELPWEGTFAFSYVTLIKDGDRYRMYYRTYPGGETADGGTKEMTCYAESSDGIHWVKPELGIFEILGTKKNNAVLAGMAPYTHNFAPLLDARPGVAAAGAIQGPGRHFSRRVGGLRLARRIALEKTARKAGDQV